MIDAVRFYKIGLELFMAGDYFELIDWLQQRRKKIFVDLKFFDVPASVGRALRALSQRSVECATIHGNDAIMAAAAREKGDLKILAVTVLRHLEKINLPALLVYGPVFCVAPRVT